MMNTLGRFCKSSEKSCYVFGSCGIRKGYYSKFVEGFHLIVAPLTKLLRNGVPFKRKKDQHSDLKS
ncbi:Integrase, catalytic core [Gossypium australe]|uniref:Integrase, catalytic core n=1 Tax=Gossypium australe TaxID=47621 RepID=A0A5B6W7R0_9ROSI|nr:Integrase, catalytic core [Gossypium australe]